MSTLSSFVYRAELHFASKDSWDALTALTLQVGYVSREARGVAEETYNLLRMAGYTPQQIDKEISGASGGSLAPLSYLLP